MAAKTETRALLDQKMAFGITIDRIDAEEMDLILDDIDDQLTDDGFTPDEWDMIAWFRGSTCFIIMYAPLLTRASLLKVDGIERIRPLSHTASNMMDNRNTWYLPITRKTDTLTRAERAAEQLTQWQQEILAAAGGVREEHEEATLEERLHEVSDAPLPRRGRKAEAVSKVGTASELMALLNLQGAKDSGGKTFVFGAED